MREYDIEMIRGDTLAFGIEFEGLDQNLESAFFTVKTQSSSQKYVFQKSLGDGITMAEANTYRVRVAPEDTENLSPGTYYYDLEIGVNSDVHTLLLGSFKIKQDVTF